MIERPKRVESPDTYALRVLCKKYLYFLESKDYSTDNEYDQHIFEAAIEAFYGKDVWEWVNYKIAGGEADEVVEVI